MASNGGVKVWTRQRLAILLLARPAAGLDLAGRVGQHLGRFPGLRVSPSRGEVARIFGSLPASELERVCREMGAHERQNQALLCLLRQRGLEPVVPLIEVRGEERLHRLRQGSEPALLVTWHVGAPVAPLAAFAKLGVTVITLLQNAPFPPGYTPPSPVQWVVGESLRMAFLKRALDRLREGGVVFMAPDGDVGSAFFEVPFLGGKVPLGRGVSTLARRSGARILPTTTRWSARGGRIEMEIHDPLVLPEGVAADKDAQERAVLEAIAGWFEGWVRSHPGDLRVRWLRRYLGSGDEASARGEPAEATGQAP